MFIRNIRSPSGQSPSTEGAETVRQQKADNLPLCCLPAAFLNWCYGGFECCRSDKLHYEYRKAECSLWLG